MNEVRVITEGAMNCDSLEVAGWGWGDKANGAFVAGQIRHIELRKDGMPMLGIRVMEDGSLHLETFGHVYTMELPGQVVLNGGE